MMGGFSLMSMAGDPMNIDNSPQETTQAVYFHHGNNAVDPARVMSGASISACSNGMISGVESSSTRKHTKNFNIWEWLQGAFENVKKWLGTQNQQIGLLASRNVPADFHRDIILSWARKGQLTWPQVGAIDNLWQRAVLDDFDKTDNWQTPWAETWEKWNPSKPKMWDWYNCVTAALREMPPQVQIQTLKMSYHTALDTCGYDLTKIKSAA